MANFGRNPGRTTDCALSPPGPYAMLLRLGTGGIAAVIAQTCCQPIETIKVRLQNEANCGSVAKKYRSFTNGAMIVASEEGIARGLWKGMLPAAMRELSYSSLRFGLFQPIKQLLGDTNPRDTPFWKKMVAGGAAGGLGSAIANPFDILKIRMQADVNTPATSMMSHMKQIHCNEGGIPGFWRGVSTTVTRAVVLGATKLAVYDESKIHLNQHFGLTGLALQASGATCAGFAYCLTTAPADFTRTRYMAAKQMAAQTGVAMQYKGPIDVVVQTMLKEGPRAFYKGFLPQWARATPYSIVQFIVWERLSSMFELSTT